MSVSLGSHKWREPVMINQVWIQILQTKQHLNHLNLVILYSAMQCRTAVGVASLVGVFQKLLREQPCYSQVSFDGGPSE